MGSYGLFPEKAEMTGLSRLVPLLPEYIPSRDGHKGANRGRQQSCVSVLLEQPRYSYDQHTNNDCQKSPGYHLVPGTLH